ncbi:chemotaxis protein CheW [bacterium]
MDSDSNSMNTQNMTDEDVQIYTEFNMQNVLWFSLGEEEYAIKVDDVQSVLDEFTLTPIPNTPGFVLGVINLRGLIIPVVDLKRMFQMPREEKENPMIIVLEMSELESTRVGIVVDTVNEVLEIDFSTLQPPPPLTVGAGRRIYFRPSQNVLSRPDNSQHAQDRADSKRNDRKVHLMETG